MAYRKLQNAFKDFKSRIDISYFINRPFPALPTPQQKKLIPKISLFEYNCYGNLFVTQRAVTMRLRLAVLFLLIALIPSFFIGIFTFANYKNSLETERLSTLRDITAFKTDKIEAYFAGVKKDIEIAQSSWCIQKSLPAIIKFSRDTNNQEFITAKKVLDGRLKPMQKSLGLIDIILAGPDGKILYSSNPARNQRDFLKSLPDPEDKAFKNGKDKIYVTDIFQNKSEDDKLSMLVSAPAVGPEGLFIGVIVFEINMSPLYVLIQDATGMGNTGETLICKRAGNEVVYLNSLRHAPESALKKKVAIGDKAAIPAQRAVNGDKGSGYSIDYRNKKVIAAWSYIPSLGWGIVAKIDAEEAFADVTALEFLLIVILVIITFLAAITAFLIAKAISDAYDNLNKEILTRKKAEEALRRSEAWLSTTLKSIGDAVIATDMKGSLTFMNAVASKLTGWKQEEAFGKPLQDIFKIINEKTGERAENPVDKVLKEGTVVGLANHTILITRGGTRCPIDDSAAPIKDANGDFIGVVLIFRDITKQRQMLDIKNNFMNMVSHELRTPLSSIKESIALVLDGAVGAISPRQKEMLDIGRNNIDRLSRLISQVLDFQQIDSGSMKFDFKENDINEAVREAQRSLVSLAGKKGLKLTLDLDKGLPSANFDKDKILEVLINLTNNAIKFTEKGSVTISTGQQDNIIKVSVKDTGPGIKEDDMPKLFQLFSQVERKAGGSGLGLAISKELIEAHRGRIWAESEPGKGTVFCLTLPVKERRR